MPYPYPDTITGPELVAEYASIIKGKTILTTGVSPNTLGATYVESVAAGQPKLIILAGRSLDKVKQTAELVAKAHPEVKTKVLELDLTLFASVRKAAEEVNSWGDVPVIDVLVNNAGIMAVPYEICVDGFEKQFTANHLGHFLFTNLILDKILAAKDGRVVNISSGAHYISGIRHADINFDQGKTYEKWAAYAQSKTAGILFSRELAKRLGDRGLLSFSANPGAIGTTHLAAHLDFSPGKDAEETFSRMGGAPYGWQIPELISPERGVSSHVFASFDPVLKAHNGAYIEQRARIADYYVDCVSPAAISDIEAGKLWPLSAKAVGL
ncbi:hypothetical protein TRIATDRAFT_224995 [Trichoderma atroviride IMI 206040]|uniref:Oxidoreductase n=1 Tax=Hypocrea atroviridis (strain ATCC 20476 / IMI 206040) TaxID=452589 RepID=G9P3H2_HYPAI|nr:uncharacterized protein TRIATDRAFT_224995 [Trichoderma atroviride IMI 206040]EHK42930.1 hypothetical protein TRIATDRAFT_224995 [Trichoderma atroviride IMI 206040]